MAFDREQIVIINEALKTGKLSDARFSGSEFFANAVQGTKKTDNGDVYSPYYFDDNGKEIYVGLNDDAPLRIYHRVIGSTYNTSNNYGNRNLWLNQTINAYMVVYGKVARVKLRSDEIEMLLVAGFPDIIEKNLLPTGLVDMGVNVTSSTTEQRTIFNIEFPNGDFRLSAEDIYVRINYTITSRFNKDCVKICC